MIALQIFKNNTVIPVKTGIHVNQRLAFLDSRLRGNDATSKISLRPLRLSGEIKNIRQSLYCEGFAYAE